MTSFHSKFVVSYKGYVLVVFVCLFDISELFYVRGAGQKEEVNIWGVSESYSGYQIENFQKVSILIVFH